MVTPNNHPQKGCYGKPQRKDSDYDSPYLQISDEHFQYESASSSFQDAMASVNSFLQEAEIVRPSTVQNLAEANEKMRTKLNSFFMDPVEKWKRRGRFPWKLCVQVVGIILATVQMCLFGYHSFGYVQQHLDMTTTLGRILLKDWEQDTTVYPPSDVYAIYTVPDFYDHIDFLIRQYTKINSIAVGPFGYDNPENVLMPMKFCFKQYEGHVFAGNVSINIEDLPEETCLKIPAQYPEWDKFSIQEFLLNSNVTINFKTLIHVVVHLRLRTVFIKSLSRVDYPECYRLKLYVQYDNSEHDGRVLITLQIRSQKIECNICHTVGDEDENAYILFRQVLNIFVIIFCLLSAILCLRSLFAGCRLAKETSVFFKEFYNKDIPLWELLDFIDFWYVNILVSNVLLICGSAIKIEIEEKSAEGVEYAKCSILLGVGNLLVWIGILRYLGFFPKYNMLILTVKRALPNVLRFLLCAVMLFVGSCFCAWIVLAPYHIKFRSLSRTAECLFSIMNGDDMFATFALLDTRLDVIWWFSRIFLYGFLVVFIYIVVSLFISVIMDTFETIKHMYVYGAPPRTAVEVFLTNTALTNPTAPESSSSTPTDFNNVSFFKRIWNRLKFKWHRFMR